MLTSIRGSIGRIRRITISRTSLKARIYAYLRTKPGAWVASAEIERLTFDNTSYIASNATRRLRELHEEKPERVERDYRKGKHGETLAYYRYVPSPHELYKAKVDGHALAPTAVVGEPKPSTAVHL